MTMVESLLDYVQRLVKNTGFRASVYLVSEQCVFILGGE